MDAFVGEIRMFGFGFVPSGWAFCNGQLMAIRQNPTLYSLLGTLYGGDGRSSFGLPNLPGFLPVGQGQGPGLSSWNPGQTGGAGATVTLNYTQLAAHNHGLVATSDTAQGTSVSGQQLATASKGNLIQSFDGLIYSSDTSPDVPLNLGSLVPVGGSGQHNNLMPYLGLNYCICLLGDYPSRQ